VTLAVRTARVAYGGPDRLDITRKGNHPEGIAVAPSELTLRPVLDARRAFARMVKDLDALAGRAQQGGLFEGAEARLAEMRETRAIFEARLNETWLAYVDTYHAEMRESYRARRDAWDALLARRRVVLVCFCVDPERCHRTLLGRSILPKLGATYEGEIT